MNRRSRTLAIVLGAVVLAGAAGIGVAASGDSSTAGATPTMNRQGGPGGGFDLSALATELGVSESRLQAALEAARPAGGGGPPSADGATMAETLADELGLSVDKVEEALEATMPSGDGGRGGSGGPGGGGPGGGDPPPDAGAPGGSSAPDSSPPDPSTPDDSTAPDASSTVRS
jgi:hypothetical protein